MDWKGGREARWNRIANIESSCESLLESPDVVTQLDHQLLETDAGSEEKFRLTRSAVRIHTNSKGGVQ